MAKPDIQVGSKIKVVDKKSPYYRWWGSVYEEIVQKVGNLAGAACSKLTIGHCKKIIIGK